jgi:hypothetical protein
MANTAPSIDWQRRVAQEQADRAARMERLRKGPATLRNAMLDTPLGEAEGKVYTVGDALKFEQYLAIPNEATSDGKGIAFPLVQALADKREEIGARSSQFINALLHTREGPTSTHRSNLCAAVLEFCGMLQLAVQTGDAHDAHSESYAVTDSSCYQLALSLENAIPEIERALLHAKDRINGLAPLVDKRAPASR